MIIRNNTSLLLSRQQDSTREPMCRFFDYARGESFGVFVPIVICFFMIIVPLSCSTGLSEDDFCGPEPEMVSGFKVNWRKQVSPEQKNVIRSVLDNMVYVKGGYFMMGATDNQSEFAQNVEYPAHLVKLSDYYICKYELSYEEVTALLSLPTRGALTDDTHLSSGEYYNYGWDDWMFLVRLLRDYTGLPFDLPTEAQWEYAARGGVYSNGYLYAGSNALSDVWSPEVGRETGSIPNELGLCNMSDGLSEWCKDIFDEYGDDTIVTDPCVVGVDSQDHIVRGGNYMSTGTSGFYGISSFYSVEDDARSCRVTARMYHDSKSWKIGCRLVMNHK